MRHKLRRSAKEPVDHGGAWRGSAGKGSLKAMQMRWGSATGEGAGMWISAATAVSANITVTRRQTGVISLTRTGRYRRSSAHEGQR